ncbi:MAG: SUMF1/EgtB/PvdO family nonheme iron enzyme [bacterium]
MPTCKKCKKPICSSWNVCPSCGEDVYSILQSFPCQNCGYSLHSEWISCPMCGYQTGAIVLSVENYRKINYKQTALLKKHSIEIIEDLNELNLVLIPMSEYIMGSNKYPEERPKHDVYVKSFWMCRYPVTNAEYALFVEESGHEKPAFFDNKDFSKKKQPAVGIGWDDANAYCAWLSQKKGFTFRLPTEAEWEKAGKGTDDRKYPWGNNWELDRCNNNENRSRRTCGVGNFKFGTSPYRLFNMAGNVWEWCQDWYDKNYYTVSSYTDPQGPSSGKKKIIRGGSWKDNGNAMRVSKRCCADPGFKADNIGFRFLMEDD